MALQHWLFVNRSGRKFKTTNSGKTRYLSDKKLGCVLVGPCDERGVPVFPESPTQISKETSTKVNEIIEASKEKKFVEPEISEKFNPKNKNGEK